MLMAGTGCRETGMASRMLGLVVVVVVMIVAAVELCKHTSLLALVDLSLLLMMMGRCRHRSYSFGSEMVVARDRMVFVREC